MGWGDFFFKKERIFLTLLEKEMKITQSLTELLKSYVSDIGENEREVIAAKASDVEHQGDDVRAAIMKHLETLLVTPFDREDINALSRAIDDIADYSENTIKEIRIYRIEPDRFIREMVETLDRAVHLLTDSIFNLYRDRTKCKKTLLEAKAMENKIEGIYRKAISALDEMEDIHRVIKLREVYRHLSNAADRVDTAANRLMTIMVKEGE